MCEWRRPKLTKMLLSQCANGGPFEYGRFSVFSPPPYTQCEKKIFGKGAGVKLGFLCFASNHFHDNLFECLPCKALAYSFATHRPCCTTACVDFKDYKLYCPRTVPVKKEPVFWPISHMRSCVISEPCSERSISRPECSENELIHYTHALLVQYSMFSFCVSLAL